MLSNVPPTKVPNGATKLGLLNDIQQSKDETVIRKIELPNDKITKLKVDNVGNG